MGNLNCMVQYATRHATLIDTDLITKDDAIKLFNKNKDDYMKRLSNGEEPEMAVWCNCKTNSSYSETIHYWNSDSTTVIDDELWQRV